MTPDEFTNEELMLDVGDDHQLYVQDWGNTKAKTSILFLHGGPGSSCNDGHKDCFDPAKHRVIFFDQRGAGKSLPYGSLEHNTTQDLVNDISTILDHFKLSAVILCGRSWGSTSALTYAIQNPDRVTTIVTGGVWLGNKAEAALEERTNIARLFYPDVLDRLSHQGNTYELWQQVLSEDAEAAKQTAYKLAQLLGTQLRLDDRGTPPPYDTFDPSGLRIEAHYKTQDWFLEGNYILQNVQKLTMPVWIIQGRYDMSCLPKFAYELHTKLQNSHLLWTQAGHSGNDRENWLATRGILEQLVTD